MSTLDLAVCVNYKVDDAKTEQELSTNITTEAQLGPSPETIPLDAGHL